MRRGGIRVQRFNPVDCALIVHSLAIMLRARGALASVVAIFAKVTSDICVSFRVVAQSIWDPRHIRTRRRSGKRVEKKATFVSHREPKHSGSRCLMRTLHFRSEAQRPAPDNGAEQGSRRAQDDAQSCRVSAADRKQRYARWHAQSDRKCDY